MVESLCTELAHIGLSLNPFKTRVFTSVDVDVPAYLDMGGGLVNVLAGTKTHKYLGRASPRDLKSRGKVDIYRRVQSAWAAFHKFRHVLTDKKVSLRSRLRLFPKHELCE